MQRCRYIVCFKTLKYRKVAQPGDFCRKLGRGCDRDGSGVIMGDV